jgi:hypothetical protein
MKIRPLRGELFCADRQTDRHDEVTGRFSQFCEKRLKRKNGGFILFLIFLIFSSSFSHSILFFLTEHPVEVIDAPVSPSRSLDSNLGPETRLRLLGLFIPSKYMLNIILKKIMTLLPNPFQVFVHHSPTVRRCTKNTVDKKLQNNPKISKT